jgi:enoyl-CoA hydratase/carnithine racemase
MNRLTLIKNQLNNSNQNKDLVLISDAQDVKGVKIVTMNSGLNALSKELMISLYQSLVKLDNDQDCRVIILTGGKGKAFAAGADIKRLNQTPYSEIVKNDWFLQPLEYISYHITKPIIAAVNGIAYGGGFELALACDIIIVSDKSAFAFPELRLGLFPGAGGTQRLTRLMGYHKAMEYILTTKDIPLSELKSFGVVNEVVPHDELMRCCIKMAESIAKFSLMSIYAAKKAMKMSQETGLYSGLKTEKYLFEALFSTLDKKSGVEGFLNKKPAKFEDK